MQCRHDHRPGSQVFVLTIRFFLTVFGMLLLLAAVPAWSQSPQGRGPQPFEAYDEDGDGYLSRAEFEAMREERRAARERAGMPMRGAGRAPDFSDFDGNGDGKLSQEELVAGQQAMRGARGARGGPGGGAGPGARGAMGGQMPSFDDFDLDGDGVVSEDEFVKARNDRLTERANEGRPLRNLADAPSFSDIDENDDGAISPDEFARHRGRQRENRPR